MIKLLIIRKNKEKLSDRVKEYYENKKKPISIDKVDIKRIMLSKKILW